MSLRMSSSRLSPAACSGLMYAIVPTSSPTLVRIVVTWRSASVSRAMPKSRILGWPIAISTPESTRVPLPVSSSTTSTFAGLRSRCTTPFWCA